MVPYKLSKNLLYLYVKKICLNKLLTCLLLICCSWLHAQEYVIDMKHWDVKDGLPHRQVSVVYQDRSGLIWAGTQQGLSRFDGYHFLNYTKEKNGLPCSRVDAIAEDALGRLWLLSHDKPYKYFIFNALTGEISSVQKTIRDSIPEQIWSFKTMADSSILIETADNTGHTFYTWRPDRGLHKCVIPAQYAVLCALPERNCIMAENDSNEIMQVDFKGNILKRRKAPFVKGSWIAALVVDYRYVPDDVHHVVYRVSPDLDITQVQDLPQNEVYGTFEIFGAGKDDITFAKGKLIKPGRGVIYEFTPQSFPGEDASYRFLLKDKKERLWIGNDFGLNLLTISKNKFTHYYNDSSKKGYENTCRGLYPWGRFLYVCSEFWGLFRIDMATHASKRMFRIFSYSMDKVADGLLMGYSDGVCRMDEQGKPTFFKSALPGWSNAWSIYHCANGKVLVGGAGLAWFNDSTGIVSQFTQYNGFEELRQAQILYIAPDRNGQLWLCADNGFYSLDIVKGVTGRYSADDTGSHFLPASDCRHFYQDPAGTYWIATASGLIKWDKTAHSSRLYTQSDGLSNNNLYAVYGDGGGNLWMSSDYGIIRLNKQSGAVRTYTTEDGISNNEFNRPSHYQDDSGKIYFGSLDGVNVFDPRDFVSDAEEQKNMSPLIITSFLQFNGETNKLEDKRSLLMQDYTITMRPQDRFFNLEFALLNYSNTQQTTYYWKIDGIDTGWNMQKDRTLRLSRLPYDEHLLHIKAQDANGSWSKNEITIKIYVVRPFYLRLWFLFVSVITAIAIVIVSYRWRLYLLRRENERLDRVVKEKTEDLILSLQQKEILLKEIHHRVKNNLQVISSLLRLQSHSVQDVAAKNALLEGQNRVLSIALIHQKLYQDEKLDMVEFATFADELFTQLRGVFGAGAEVKFVNEMQETFLGIDTAVPLGLILNELITNSFKYAFKNIAAPCIKLQLEKNKETYRLTYSDNGTGLPADVHIEHSKSLGLRLVNRLSKQLNGNAVYIKNEWSNFVVTFTGSKAG